MRTTSSHSRDKSSLTNSIQHWLLGLLLCCGGAIVWGLLFSYIGEWGTWWFNRNNAYEYTTAQLRDNGELYLKVTRNSKNQQVQELEYKTVKGQPIVLSDEELKRDLKTTWQTSAIPSYYQDRRHNSYGYTLWIDVPEPLPWELRLERFDVGTGYSGEGQHWYFHRPRRAGGSGYFEGFDLKTKRRIGFIGSNGFSGTAPAMAEQFPAWDVNKSKVAAFVSQNHIDSPQTGVVFLTRRNESPENGCWLITPHRERVYVINFNRRSVLATREVSGKLLGTISQYDVMRRVQHATRALFWEDRMEIVSPTLETLSEIRFPAELHGKISAFTELPSGEFEATYHSISPKPREIPADQHFVRFNERGEVTLRRTVTIPLGKPEGYWFAEKYLPPFSLMPLNIASWLAPYRSGYFFSDVEEGQPLRRDDEPMTWPLRFRALRLEIRNLGWGVSFWVTLLSGVPFAALCLWRQRTLQVTVFDRIAWPLLLCVFGLVGWVALVTHRRWPQRRAACGTGSQSDTSPTRKRVNE